LAESSTHADYPKTADSTALLVPAMSERQKSPYDNIARRWLALVERREQHFADLSQSGRWRRYYTQTEFLNEMRKVLQVRNQWAVLAGIPVKSLPGDDFGAREAAPIPRPAPNAQRGRPALTLVSNTASVQSARPAVVR
jgi:uncharacterized repeat protein (TIGR03809 family)